MYEIKMYEIKTIRSADEIESGNVAEIAVYNWGGEYLRAVTGKLLGIQNFHQISAEALDLPETNVVQALERAFRQAEALAETL